VTGPVAQDFAVRADQPPVGCRPGRWTQWVIPRRSGRARTALRRACRSWWSTRGWWPVRPRAGDAGRATATGPTPSCTCCGPR